MISCLLFVLFFGSIMPFLWSRNYRIQTTALQHLLKTRRNKVTHSYVKKYNARHIYTQHTQTDFSQTCYRFTTGGAYTQKCISFHFLLSSSFFNVCLIIIFSTSLNISMHWTGFGPSKATVADFFFIFMTAEAKMSTSVELRNASRCIFSSPTFYVAMWVGWADFYIGLSLRTQVNILSWWKTKRNLDKHRAWWCAGQSAWVWPGRHRWSSLSLSLLHY